jgi:hypothetical protein
LLQARPHPTLFKAGPAPSDIIQSWSYSGDDIPPAGGENARINFWLLPPADDGPGTPRPTDGNEAEIVIKSFKYMEYVPPVKARIRITPRTLNLTSRGRWVTCKIGLPKGYKVSDINAPTLLLENEIEAAWSRLRGRRRTGLVKFSRSQLQQLLADRGELGNVQLTVTGEFKDGAKFEGTDTIRLINKGKKPPRIKNKTKTQREKHVRERKKNRSKKNKGRK